MADRKILSLQVLRAIAATMVVWNHAGYLAHKLAGDNAVWNWRYQNLGAAGVDIFFVLSGAIIYHTAFATRRWTPLDFLRKRFLRIAPTYYLVTIASLPVLATIGAPAPTTWRSLATAFCFWPTWHFAGIVTSNNYNAGFTLPPLAVGWSLCFEMLFYCSAALVLFSRVFLVVLPFCFVIAWRLSATVHWPIFTFIGNPMILEFILGVAISWLWRPKNPAPVWFGATLFVFGAAAMTLLCFPPGTYVFGLTISGEAAAFRVVVWGFPAGLMLLGALAIEAHLAPQHWIRLPVFLGDASYATYLIHWPLLIGLGWAIGNFPSPTVMIFALIVVTLAASSLFYLYVETPLLTALRSHRHSVIGKRLAQP